MRTFFIAIGLVFQLIASAAFANLPEAALREMIERDMAGDPSVRVNLAAAAATVVESGRQTERASIAFELDADALEVAKEWRLEEGQHKCFSKVCSIGVVYLVVATTKGSGVPSWSNARGREILPLGRPVERLVRYRLRKIGEQWKIDKFPPPYVAPDVLMQFFVEELKKAKSVSLPAAADGRVVQNREILRVWRERQIEVLAKLTS